MKNTTATPDSKELKSQYMPSAEFYSQIIDSLQDYSIFTLDKQLKINSWSSGSVQVFGYEPEEAMGQSFDLIFTKEDLDDEIPALEIARANKDGRATDNRWHVCKNGDKIFAYGLVFPLESKEGELIGYVKILRDITEKQKSEDSIKKYVKELEDLITHKESILAIVSHDLRSPLAGIITTADYLRTNFKRMDAAKVQKMLDMLFDSTRDELAMLDYLVEWARIKYASEAFVPSEINIHDAVVKVFDMLGENAVTAGVQLKNLINPDAKVFADGKMLNSILQNLIANGIKHTDKKGVIEVNAHEKDGMMIVAIKDNGLGMPEEVRLKLFTPRMTSLLQAREDNKGAGIGLFLTKGFLQTNGGEIWVESAEGTGSTFYFSLPLKEGEKAPAPKFTDAPKADAPVSDQSKSPKPQ